MRFSSHRSDADADVIRARLRALLEDRTAGGWVPDEEEEEQTGGGPAWADDSARSATPGARPDHRCEVEEPEPPVLPPGIGRHRAPGPTARWDPGRGGARSLWLAALVAGLLVAAWTWLDRPRVEPAPSPAGETLGAGTDASAPVGVPTETSEAEAEAVVVSVVGSVARPGLVTLPAGARVADAVQAAGGLLAEADPASINLAALVPDGAQIAVGVPGAGPESSVGAAAAAGAGSGSRLDLNTASAGELDALPGIGPVLAQRIVDHRSRNGPFTAVDQLDDVPGIGPATAAELGELVSV